ncbi:P-type conjugative transfer protein TrbG [Phenylobacterium sp.]|uniref:P-type conjugative transfer protein TrbG n=1 Tax=Phenylobacterium sp. TaxID=1871053 RepID=UPI0035AEEBCE
MTPSALACPSLAALAALLVGPGCAAIPKAPLRQASVPVAAVLTPAILAPAPVLPPPPALPAPQPGQLKPMPSRAPAIAPLDGPPRRVALANADARIQPTRDGFVNAMQRYAYADGALYQVYAAPGQVTDIALEPGETLVGAGAVAAGDTVRWIIGDTESGAGAFRRVHVLLKPTAHDLVTNLIINTDRRTYHLELRATPATYMAEVSWTYPQDALIALRAKASEAAATAPAASGLDLDALDFGYRIEGDKVPWRPIRAFDDGKRVYIEFPTNVGQDEMPPLFVLGAGRQGELVNYRIAGRRMIVDRLFAVAELRLGDKHDARRVRIVRATPEARR